MVEKLFLWNKINRGDSMKEHSFVIGIHTAEEIGYKIKNTTKLTDSIFSFSIYVWKFELSVDLFDW